MTNEEQWVVARMNDLMTFQSRLEEFEMWVSNTSEKQKEALNNLYDAIDELVIADAEAIGVIKNA